MAHITIAGNELYYDRVGSGSPLLLIMGMSGTTSLWGQELIGPLSEHHEVIVYDHRGAGRSSRVSEPFSTLDLATDALALLDALDHEAAHVFGISMGGMVAQELALAAPQRVCSMALGCTWAGGEAAVFPDPADVEELLALTQPMDPAALLRRSFALNVSAHYASEPAHLELFLARCTEHPTPQATTALQFGAAITHDTGLRLAEVQTPTLVLHGTDDRVLPIANGEFIADAVPSAQIERFAGAGHLFWWEQPTAAVDALLEHTGARART